MPELVSCNAIGRQPLKGLEYPSRPSISGEGDRIAFSSEAGDLVAEDTNEAEDVFLRTRSQGSTQRFSLTSSGEQVPGGGFSPSLSQDGTQLAFISRSAGLCGDDEERCVLYLRDLETGRLERIGADPEGRAFKWSNYPQLSADGRVVLFQASYVDDSDHHVLLLLDRDKNTAEVLDRCAIGARLRTVTLCADGKHLAVATMERLTEMDTGGTNNIYVVDGESGAPRLLTHSPRKSSTRKGQWAKARGWSEDPVLSGDGGLVAYASSANNLVPKDRNGKKDIFVTEVSTEKTERMSVSSAGQEANEDCYDPSVSADGRFVSFLSRATNLTDDRVIGDKTNLFVRDRKTGRTYLANRDDDGVQGNCRGATLSADGLWIAYVANRDPNGPEEDWPEQVYVVPNPAHETTQARMLGEKLRVLRESLQTGGRQIVRVEGGILVGGIRLRVRGG